MGAVINGGGGGGRAGGGPQTRKGGVASSPIKRRNLENILAKVAGDIRMFE